jgi:hypothetical protein
VDGVDDLGVVDPAQVGGRDPEIGVPELPLDNDHRHPFTGHLHGVRVSQLVRRESAADPSCAGGIAQLPPDSGGRARAAASCSAKHTEDSADRERGSESEPRLKLFPSPSVHPDFAPLAALAVADQHGAARSVQVALRES